VTKNSKPSFCPAAPLAWIGRALLKAALFGAVVLFILNPNLKRAAMHVRHALQPDLLIQTNFPALREINTQVDEWLAASRGTRSEVQVVERFVNQRIQYVSDYKNWGNIEYWPTAEEVWERGKEDCDGRAVLAVSILRSRGYESARLVIGLDHMWVQVDENERLSHRPEKVSALLNPSGTQSLELAHPSGVSHFASVGKALLRPKAFRETSVNMIAEIPAPRKFLIVLSLLLICGWPLRHRMALGIVLALGPLSAALLSVPKKPGASHPEFLFCLCLLALALLGAGFYNRFALLLQRRGLNPAETSAATLTLPPTS
jgi:predicted transglutaminase-like cysteine proteinase